VTADAPWSAEVAIVVLSWNGWDDTQECLRSLHAAEGDFTVILVDNGSTDETVDRTRHQFPDVRVVENRRNLGFAEGNNRGIEAALAGGADYVALLNNDTRVARDFLEPLLASVASLRDIGFVSPRIFYDDPPDKVWFFGSEIDWRTGWVHHRQLGGSGPDHGEYPTPTGTGCCVLASRETWQRVGLLDPRYFLYWEDADWTFRVTRAGGEGRVVAESRVWHKVSRSFDRSASSVGTYYFVRNGLLFIRKHSRQPFPTTLRFLMRWAVRPVLREARRGEDDWEAAAVLRAAAVAAALTSRYGPAPPRIARVAAGRRA
jgi:GT2 family glycosyltransferase